MAVFNISVSEGGSLIDGTADVIVYYATEVAGGITVTAQSASISTFEYVNGTGGCYLNSEAEPQVNYSTAGSGGGVTNGSHTILFYHNTVGSGGTKTSGEMHIIWYMQIAGNGQVFAGGRSTVQRRGTVQRVHNNYALAMASENRLKDALAARQAKTQVMQPVQRVYEPVGDVRSLNRTASTWCEDCKDGMLPTITVKNQSGYLPANN